MLLNIDSVKKEALKQINDEKIEKAKVILVKKLRELDAAKTIVANIEREIGDIEASLKDGSFVG